MLRSSVPWLAGLLVLAACGDDAAPPDPAPAPATAAPADAPRPAAVDLPLLAGRLLGDSPSEADRDAARTDPAGAVAAVLAAASGGDPRALGRAPGALAALGPPALPAIAAALRAPEVTSRRIAALTLLQLADGLCSRGEAGAVLPALAAAEQDPDPSVRAAAEHARRRAVGDTSALDKSRAEHDAALRGNR
ncbi:MAG: hypothetical protein FJ265_20405 [Planctomycetes bacterium]|nr:hypothetical protein [Planctomycetota bacterium]